jgi:hypothetical protein
MLKGKSKLSKRKSPLGDISMNLAKSKKEYGKEERNKPAKFKVADHWRGMPEFTEKDVQPFQRVVVNLATEADCLKFFKLIGQTYTRKTRSIWFPDISDEKYMDKRYSSKK